MSKTSHLSALIAAVVSAGWLSIAGPLVLLFTVVLFPLTVSLWLVAGTTGLVCHILGAIRASHGQPYRYPFSIRGLC